MMVKFLLLALAFGLTHAHEHAELEGQWRTLAIMADNKDLIERGGRMELFIREITCDDNDEECKEMRVSFYVNQNGQCSKTTVIGYMEEDQQTYTNQYEGENHYRLLEGTSEYLIFYDENVDRASRKSKLLYALGKGDPLTEEQKEKLLAFAKEKGIPAENIKLLTHEDICPE